MSEKKREQKLPDNIEGNEYSNVEDYQVLEDIAHIRLRAANYIGDTSEGGLHHLFQEAIDNGIDEHVAGRCDWIKVTLSDDQKTITVADNGLGMPIDIHPKTGQSVLVTVFSFLKSGGKFNQKIYKTSGGLHGIGVTAINALSQQLTVYNQRQGKIQIAEFSRGILKSEKVVETDSLDHGLTVTFLPDSEIFKDTLYFRVDIIEKRLKELSYLNPRLKLVFQSSLTPEPLIYHSEEGIVGWIKEINQDDYLLNTKVCYGEWSTDNPYFHLSFAWQYSQKQKKQYVNSFCNNINTPAGGSHVEGFETGLTAAIREWLREKYPQVKTNILKEDVTESLKAILAIRVKEPQFAGQTKNSLTDSYIRPIVKNATYDLIKKFLQDNADNATAISRKVIEVAQHRIKVEEYQKSLREVSRAVALPEKLAPCISKIVDDTELFIVEGLSAGGSAKLARDPNIQAILPLQGKILNVEKADPQKLLANKEIRNLINAIGFSVNDAIENNYYRFHRELESENKDKIYILPEEFTYYDEGTKQVIPAKTPISFEQLTVVVEQTKQELLKKVRYGKIIIMTDSDADGGHISILIETIFIRFFRYLIEDHRLFLAITPLYRWQSKKETRYILNDQELNIFRQENPNAVGYLQRFKGLGEMDAGQLRETSMRAEKRCLYELLFSDPESIWDTVDKLMGTDSSSRRKILETGERNRQLAVNDKKVDIGLSLQNDFLNYAYAVIEERALPAEDGLKPVQRRILYTCYSQGLTPNRPFRKSSKIVGDTMSRFHAHGDVPIYLAAVNMVQSFNYRYPLLQGQGNWGSIDGDSAAHQRYTEVRLSRFGYHLLEELAFDTVNWTNNYDDTEKEPEQLPPSLNLLLNGSSGIAVGMSTSMLSHNLTEVVEATIKIVQEPQSSLDEILEKIPGPDLATGGIILEQSKLRSIYERGEGTVYVRGRAEIFSSREKKPDTIRIYEIPYKVNKSNLVEEIREIIKNKKIEGLKNVEDYSSLENPVFICLRFNPDYDPQVILYQLFKYTRLQTTFVVKMRALVKGRPQLLSLLQILHNFIDLKLQHIQKKAQFIHNKNQKELENLETKRFIVNNYQKIVEIVRNSSSEEEVRIKLHETFQLKSEVISKILDTPSTFRQFTVERRAKLDEEIGALVEDSKFQQQLIVDEEQRKQNLVRELQELKKNYQHDVRRTVISNQQHYITEKQLVAHEDRLVILSYGENKKEDKFDNYITVYDQSQIESTNIPSQGKSLKTRGKNWSILKLNRRDDLWLFSNYGRLYCLEFYRLNAVNKTTNLDEEYFCRSFEGQTKPFLLSSEFFTAALPVKEENFDLGKKLLIVTQKGKIRCWNVQRLQRVGRSGKQVLNLYHYETEKCRLHEEQIQQHRVNQHLCGIICPQLRELQISMNNCSGCRKKIYREDDTIVRAIFIGENENVDLIVKRKSGDSTKNWKVSLYRTVRKKKKVLIGEEERKIDECCSSHQTFLIQHISEHQQRKENCHVRCTTSLKVREDIKSCENCHSSIFFTRQIRNKINCDQLIDIINYETKDRDHLLVLSLRAGNHLEKKNLLSLKNWIGSDNRIKKTTYCQKHWTELDNSEKKREDLNLIIEEEKNRIKNRILRSTISLENKEEILRKTKLIDERNASKDLAKRLASSPIDHLLSPAAAEEQKKDLLAHSENYHQLLQDYRNEEEEWKKIKVKIDVCSDCRKYCNKHNKGVEELLHQSCFHCSKNERLTREIKAEIDVIQNKIKTGEITEINKLNNQLRTKKKRKEELRKNLFQQRAVCPILNKLNQERKDCRICQRQAQKKYLAEIDSTIKKVLLVDLQKAVNGVEIYLLAGEDVCYYNKKDLLQFLQGSSRSKTILRDRTKLITDLKFY